jgi:error-prone DNA polymerase
MGFYSPATIVEDAKRHGVEIRPVDVVAGDWDCTLEPLSPESGDGSSAAGFGATHIGRPRASQTFGAPIPCTLGARPAVWGPTPPAGLACGPSADPEPRFAIRMGLRYVKRLGESEWRRIEAARGERPFASVADFVRRTRLDEGAVARLAEAGALSRFEPGRRGALWAAKGAARAARAAMDLEREEATPAFEGLGPGETIGWDYRTTGHSPRGHPLAPLREKLRARRLPDARTVSRLPHGRLVSYAGIVICRQRPGTASGVVFMTLEDETGFVNVVVWSRVYERHKVLVKTTSFLGVTGKLQVQEGVAHLVAESFWTPKDLLEPAKVGSRDFH